MKFLFVASETYKDPEKIERLTMFLAHGFVDGKYLRKVADAAGLPMPNPQTLVRNLVHSPAIQSFCADVNTIRNVALARTIYYDGRPDDDTEISQELRDYWDKVELLQDT